MNRYGIATLGAALLLLSCTGCVDQKPPHGTAALKKACGGILDPTAIKEAQESDNFSRAYDKSTASDSYTAAAKTLLAEDHAAYVCRIAIDDAPPSGADGLWIKFTPGQGSLFSEGQNRSYSSYKAYNLGSGMQATSESGSGDVLFLCKLKDRNTPLSVTGSLYNNLDLSVRTRFRVLFRSSLKMVKLLKCKNEINFPSPESMKPLPLEQS
ncbi:hypothetical protein ACFOOM_32875 [Streptomyces echinoruber]|uniref:Lipoprotein n=1 Tax=Streptomyces echinoruber TaxID=68898 RepID=A0A918RVC2_9ACTN|nr:hypothetical protein [Streptomyces echinoruber]GHA13961.1 hypothetical protein GCM10010389_60960 [Streptomyces echinoruber]